MYAIISTGGKQYKVEKGDVIDVEKLDAQPGDKVELDVLMLSDGKKVLVEADKLAKKKVSAKVVDQHKGEKVLVFKFHKRKRYHRTKGHRQNLTQLEITTIPALAASTTKKAESEAKPAAKAAAKKTTAAAEKKPAAKKTAAKKPAAKKTAAKAE